MFFTYLSGFSNSYRFSYSISKKTSKKAWYSKYPLSGVFDETLQPNKLSSRLTREHQTYPSLLFVVKLSERKIQA